MKVFLKTVVVLPPDSEIGALVFVRSASDFPAGTLFTGVVVGRTLVDASLWSASVLMVNSNAE